MHGKDLKDPHAIPNYLEQHFKEKIKLKKQKEMMGDTTDDLKAKIEEMENVNTAGRKLVNVKEFNKRKEKLKAEE